MALLSSLLSVALLASAALAHPAPEARSTGLHKRIIDLQSLRLPQVASYTNATAIATNSSIALVKRATYEETATELVKATFPDAEFRLVEDHYVSDNGVAHVNFKQTVHGIDIDNADFNVNVGKDGEVFSFGNSFFTGEIPESSPLTKREFSDPVDALKGAIRIIQLPVDGDDAVAEPKEGNEIFTLTGTTGAEQDPEARLVYLQKEDGTLALTWRVETDVSSNWLLSYVDANSNDEVHGVVDYVAEADYLVYPWGVNDPTEGARRVIRDPFDNTASPFGWHSTGRTDFRTTRGNNGNAQNNPSGGNTFENNYRPTSASLSFQFPYPNTTAAPPQYVDASITQLFYTANQYHEVLYRLGFNERAGNFQANNSGRGGRENDPVTLNTQDGSGVNNANFATPPDGSVPRMRMYTWNTANPNRDGSFEAGIVLHEYTHGLSNRLTGGPANSGCLSSFEAGGMGEGWSDFFATAIRLKPADTRARNYAMGEWAANSAGIRAFPYSTSLRTNPLTYTAVNSQRNVHEAGTVWASMLYEVMWNLIDKHGKSTAIYPAFDRNGVPTDGKFLTLKIVQDGLALQPCTPNFVSARDAIIDADRALTGGSNACEIWTGFAKRGLGTGAVFNASRRTESFTIPRGVC